MSGSVNIPRTVLILVMFSSKVFCKVDDGSCGCSKSRGSSSSSTMNCPSSDETSPFEKYTKGSSSYESAVLIAGGQFKMGTDKPVFVQDGEGPARKVTVNDFYLDVHEVTNKDFELFVDSTGHKTEVSFNIFLTNVVLFMVILC